MEISKTEQLDMELVVQSDTMVRNLRQGFLKVNLAIIFDVNFSHS